MKRYVNTISVVSLLFIVIISPHNCYSSPEKNETTAAKIVPQGKILNFIDEEDADLEARAGNKSLKILTRPLSPQTSTTTTTPRNPYFMYPQSPGFGGDVYGQASGLQPNIQHPPANHQNHHNNRVQETQQQSNGAIPDIYVQLIGAMEKLVGRIDKLDTRIRTVENILYHMTNKKQEEPEQGTCPNDFRKVEGIRGKCFRISSFVKSPMFYDWKSAENECTKSGGRLVEMLNYEDFVRVSHFLIKYSSLSNSATSDYWIGGINPGLIWIWAESGQPVDMNSKFWNDNDNGSTAPGCLKLSYSHRLNTYFFKHSPCGHSQNYICEIMDNTVSRALAHFEEQLWTENNAEMGV